MRKVIGRLNRKSGILMFKSMILPLLQYGSCFLLNCSSMERTKVQRAQNKCLRLAYKKDRRFNVKALLTEARLATWERRALAQSCRLMFKYKQCDNFIESGKPGTRFQSGPIFRIDRPFFLKIYLFFVISIPICMEQLTAKLMYNR